MISIGLEPSDYGTHSMRRTKVAPIYKKTSNLRAVQLLLERITLNLIQIVGNPRQASRCSCCF